MNQWKSARRRRKLPFGIKLFLLAAFLLAVILLAESRLTPIIEAEAMQQVHNLTLTKISEAVKRQVNAHPQAGNYHTLMQIERDEAGRIVLMAADSALLNTLVADIVIDLEQSLDELSEEKLQIPLFAASGSKLFASLGPDIPVGISGIATPNVTLTDSFVSAGINQVKHSIYLEAETQIQVVVPFGRQTATVSTQILLAEGIIIGDIPETFVQLDTSQLKE